MKEKGISGLAIVNGAGKLMGNFSISDMRCALMSARGRVGESLKGLLTLQSPGSI
jgi:CBS domain-containing protein